MQFVVSLMRWLIDNGYAFAASRKLATMQDFCMKINITIETLIIFNTNPVL